MENWKSLHSENAEKKHKFQIKLNKFLLRQHFYVFPEKKKKNIEILSWYKQVVSQSCMNEWLSG